MKVFRIVSCFLLIQSFGFIALPQKYENIQSHSFRMGDQNNLNVDVKYSLVDDKIEIDTILATLDGVLLGLYIDPISERIIQNWDQESSELGWQYKVVYGIGSGYESDIFREFIDLNGVLTISGASRNDFEVISFMDTVPEFTKEFKLFYFLVVSHAFLMLVSALITLFQTKYGSLRKLIIAALFPLIGPIIYLGAGLYKLLKFIVLWNKGLKAPTV